MLTTPFVLHFFHDWLFVRHFGNNWDVSLARVACFQSHICLSFHPARFHASTPQPGAAKTIG